MIKYPFFSIGHATRPIDEFVELIKQQGIGTVADIRSVPRSLTNPDFNQDILPKHLKSHNIEYIHIAALGGFRPKSKTVPQNINGYWTHSSFKNYADYAISNEFAAGLLTLLKQGQKNATAFMCAEQVWWRCHRRIVTDYLLIAGASVFHIIDGKNIKPAHLTPKAVTTVSGVIEYPPQP